MVSYMMARPIQGTYLDDLQMSLFRIGMLYLIRFLGSYIQKCFLDHQQLSCLRGIDSNFPSDFRSILPFDIVSSRKIAGISHPRHFVTRGD